jgi:formylglycine-generating enzyme required for sulfatase activity
MKSFRSAALLLALPVFVACASSSIVVNHTIPPKYSIVPAKSVAVAGRSADGPPYDAEDDFLNLLITKLRRRGLYEIKDERALTRGTNGLLALADRTEGDVVLLVRSPTENCWMREMVDDDADEKSYEAECNAGFTLIRARTGESIADEEISGAGVDTDYWTSWNDGMNDAAAQIIDSFAPQQEAALVRLDDTAPLAGAGVAMLANGDVAGARSLWEHALDAAPSSASLLYNLGAVCEALRDWTAARAYYEKAAGLAPAVPRYREALAQFQIRRADADRAEVDPAIAKAAREKVEAGKREAAKARAAEIAKSALNTPEGLSFLLLPAGTFTMGCTEGDDECGNEEKPPHKVTIDKPFYLAFTPTTNFQYQKCVDAGACHGQADMAKRLNPVVNVDWDEAREFCEWAGGRLPTETEWEYAARGGTEGWRFPWGNDAGGNNANFADAGGRNIEYIGMDLEANRGVAKWLGLTYPYDGTSPVGTFEKNGFGLYDMVGNAAQWTADQKGELRVLRGGSWAGTGDAGRVSMRYFAAPQVVRDTTGFRCARDAR